MSTPYKEPAFPIKGGVHEHEYSGMTLRDYFAAKAMAALITEPSWNQDGSGSALVFALTNDLTFCGANRYAAAAYRIADAMLKARAAA